MNKLLIKPIHFVHNKKYTIFSFIFQIKTDSTSRKVFVILRT